MGIFIYIIFLILFIYGAYLSNKKDISSVFYIIGMVLMALQLLSFLGGVNVPYTGYTKEYFSSTFMYYIAFIAFYCGVFMWAIIALLLVYIPLLINHIKYKKEQNIGEPIIDTHQEDETLNILINQIEKNNQKNR